METPQSVSTFLVTVLVLIIVSIYPRESAAEEQSSWVKINEDKDIHIFTKNISESPLIAVKGISNLDANIFKAADIITNNQKFAEWVPRLLTAYTIKDNSPGEWIEYILLNAPWPLKNREFVLEKIMEINEARNQIIIKFHSVDSSLKPENNTNIRAVIYYGSFILTRINDNQSQIEIISHADLKGFIPDLVKNYLQKVWPLRTLVRLKIQALK